MFHLLRSSLSFSLSLHFLLSVSSFFCQVFSISLVSSDSFFFFFFSLSMLMFSKHLDSCLNFEFCFWEQFRYLFYYYFLIFWGSEYVCVCDVCSRLIASKSYVDLGCVWPIQLSPSFYFIALECVKPPSSHAETGFQTHT